jgi:hypothetical protein
MGKYTDKNGRLSGTLSPDGRTFNGVWMQEPTFNGPRDAGAMLLRLSDDGRTFTGEWSYGDGPAAGTWNGTRRSAP